MIDPPLPHLTGEKAPLMTRQRGNWSAPILNTLALIFGSMFLLAGASSVSIFIQSPKYITTFASQNIPAIVATALYLLLGTYMIMRGVQGFVELARQRKENAG